LTEDEFRIVFSKTLKKCEMKKEIEDALVNLLKNEENEITYQRLCKLLDFYTYVFMSQQIKSDNLFDYDPITCKPKKE
jgi:hypothetical protein